MRFVPMWLFNSDVFQFWFLRHVYFRIWCPGGSGRVRDCVASGTCGCENGRKR